MQEGVSLTLSSSLVYARGYEIPTSNRRVQCIVFVAFISLTRAGAWPKGGSAARVHPWPGSVLLPEHPRCCSCPCTDTSDPRGASLLFSCPSAVLELHHPLRFSHTALLRVSGCAVLLTGGSIIPTGCSVLSQGAQFSHSWAGNSG